ncbi:hypothetical protein BJ741DRAFT_588225 [Chytriomyces cf. hyalinus JEL632]|nr:hypothetical protein BJ741DRAFT_588225 [Chytriomyces cf. hyalinus JEL632]
MQQQQGKEPRLLSARTTRERTSSNQPSNPLESYGTPKSAKLQSVWTSFKKAISRTSSKASLLADNIKSAAPLVPDAKPFDSATATLSSSSRTFHNNQSTECVEANAAGGVMDLYKAPIEDRITQTSSSTTTASDTDLAGNHALSFSTVQTKTLERESAAMPSPSLFFERPEHQSGGTASAALPIITESVALTPMPLASYSYPSTAAISPSPSTFRSNYRRLSHSESSLTALAEGDATIERKRGSVPKSRPQSMIINTNFGALLIDMEEPPKRTITRNPSSVSFPGSVKAPGEGDASSYAAPIRLSTQSIALGPMSAQLTDRPLAQDVETMFRDLEEMLLSTQDLDQSLTDGSAVNAHQP